MFFAEFSSDFFFAIAVALLFLLTLLSAFIAIVRIRRRAVLEKSAPGQAESAAIRSRDNRSGFERQIFGRIAGLIGL